MVIEQVLRAEHLKKYFGAVHAVEDVSLEVMRGEIFGFLGPNGAGKTTTISMLLGLTYATSGEVNVLGERVTPGNNRVLRRVGMMVGAPALLNAFSARQNLACLAHLYPELPRERIDEVLALVGLQGVERRKVAKFSTGMKQRLGLGLALLNRPELLILDEPTNGMDPAGMHEVRMLLRSLAEQGTTVFLSSHLLHEMELVCDRVAVVQQGSIVAQGSVKELLGGTQERIRVQTADPERSARHLRTLTGAVVLEVGPDYLDVQGLTSEVIMYHLVTEGLTPKEVSVSRPDLEQVFLKLTAEKVS